MKLLKLSTSVLFLGMISLNSMAQKIKLIEGDLAPLAGESSLMVKFAYDNMRVGKYDKESDYIAKKVEDYNKKEPGRGDTWAKSWVGDREREFEPKFVDLFDKSGNITISRKKPTKYTLVFKTLFTEPGYNVVITRKNAVINAEAWIVQTGSEKVIAKISITKAPGRTYGGYDYDTGVRIAECYAISGKKLAKFIKKKAK
jgi:hypothetical protein